jgi:hypothetical protein
VYAQPTPLNIFANHSEEGKNNCLILSH